MILLRCLSIASLVVLLSLPGCAGSQPSDTEQAQPSQQPAAAKNIEPGTETPKELLVRLQDAYRNRDIDLFASCVCPPSLTDGEREIYHAAIDLTLTNIEVRQFLEAAEAKYGSEELATALAKIDKFGIRGFRFLAAYPDWQRFIDEGVVEEDGEYVNIELPQTEEEKNNPVEFVATRVRAESIDGRWYFMWGVPVMPASGSVRRKQVLLTFLEAANAALAASDTADALAARIAEPLETMKQDRKPTAEERAAMDKRVKVLKARSEAKRKGEKRNEAE